MVRPPGVQNQGTRKERYARRSLSRLSSLSFGAINEQLYRLGDRASLSADLSGVQFGDFWGREEPYRTHPHYERKELSRTPAI